MEENKKGGCFLLARSFVQDSELWKYKPSTWSKIWVYILEGVNYEASKTMERGEGYFNFSEDIRKIGCDITPANIKSAMRYFKDEEMITTTKTTRGVRIKVLKYAEYQDFCNYLTTTKTTSPTTIRQLSNNYPTTTITKGIKETKENKESIRRFTPPTPEEVKNYCLERNNGVDHVKWHNFYSSKDWMIGRNKMKNWQAAVRTWEVKKEKSYTDRELPKTENISEEQRLKNLEKLSFIKNKLNFNMKKNG